MTTEDASPVPTGPSRCPTALVVFDSTSGRLGLAVQAIELGLSSFGVEVEIVDVRDAPTELPVDLDLLVVGAGPRVVGRLRSLRRAEAVLHDAAPEGPTAGVGRWTLTVEVPQGSETLVGVFDTHCRPAQPLAQVASSAVALVARCRGLSVARRVGLRVTGVDGRLAYGERERAIEFGQLLALTCRSAGAGHGRREAVGVLRPR